MSVFNTSWSSVSNRQWLVCPSAGFSALILLPTTHSFSSPHCPQLPVHENVFLWIWNPLFLYLFSSELLQREQEGKWSPPVLFLGHLSVSQNVQGRRKRGIWNKSPAACEKLAMKLPLLPSPLKEQLFAEWAVSSDYIFQVQSCSNSGSFLLRHKKSWKLPNGIDSFWSLFYFVF